jgi:hypothetical protein
MSHDYLLLIAVPRSRGPGLREELHLVEHVFSVGDFDVWRSRLAPVDAFAALPPFLRDRIVRSAALLEEFPSPDKRWLAVEWAGKMVVSASLGDAVHGLIEGWTSDGPFEGANLLVFAPARQRNIRIIGEAAAFRAAIHSGDAVVVPYRIKEPLDQSTHDQSWFGELAAPGNGGVLALLAMSGALGPGDVMLRSPAALNLEISAPLTTLGALIRAGRMRIRAVGLSRGELPPPTFIRQCAGDNMESDERALQKTFALALRAIQDRAEAFRLLLYLEAPLDDPEIVIPVGAVFEQAGLNRVQTLAAASATRVVVAPGTYAPVALPSWCLNRHLSGPHGEPVSPTILRYKGQGSQAHVWDDLESLLKASQP